MKKTILLSALAIGALTLNAQTMALSNGGFFENWSIGVNAGATMKIGNGSYFKSARPVFGLSVNKQWTPVLGMEKIPRCPGVSPPLLLPANHSEC